MGKLQDVTVELQASKEEQQTQLAAADERLGGEITLIKQKIRYCLLWGTFFLLMFMVEDVNSCKVNTV